jgi:phosphatidate phosphatase PAH1
MCCTIYTIGFYASQVDIEVNEVPVTIHMKLDDNGAAYFVEAVDTDDEDEEIPPSNIRLTNLRIFEPQSRLSWLF